MNTMKIRNLMMAMASVAIVSSCTEEKEGPAFPESEVKVSATIGMSEEDPNARVNNLVYGNFEVTDVKLSIDNVKLILRATNEDTKKPTIVQIRDKNPQILTLVENGEVMVAPIGTVMAADGIYGKLNFDFVLPDVPEDDEMYGSSVIAKAKWFDIPAVINMQLEDEMVLQFNQGLEVDGAQDYLLTMYVDKILEGISPTLVGDGNGNGTIEVGPNNEDGNSEVYEAIIANIQNALVLKNGKFKDK